MTNPGTKPPNPGTVLQKQITDYAVDKMKNQVIDGVGGEAIKQGASGLLKESLGIVTLFVKFVDTYSKEVAKANLENVRQNLENCAHIGQCSGNIHAMKMAKDHAITVWQAPDRYWYFHPQPNYAPKHAKQIYRSTMDGGWRIEKPGRSEFVLARCKACYAANAPTADAPG
jgi:hypothetical protein